MHACTCDRGMERERHRKNERAWLQNCIRDVLLHLWDPTSREIREWLRNILVCWLLASSCSFQSSPPFPDLRNGSRTFKGSLSSAGTMPSFAVSKEMVGSQIWRTDLVPPQSLFTTWSTEHMAWLWLHVHSREQSPGFQGWPTSAWLSILVDFFHETPYNEQLFLRC